MPRRKEGPGHGVGLEGTEVPSTSSSVLGFLVLKVGHLFEWPLAASGSFCTLRRGKARGHKFRLALRAHQGIG